MQCGHCGTQVNAGFFVCTGCGAHAAQPARLIGYLVIAFGALVTFSSFLQNNVRDIFIGIAIMIGGKLLLNFLKRIAPINWYRRY